MFRHVTPEQKRGKREKIIENSKGYVCLQYIVIANYFHNHHLLTGGCHSVSIKNMKKN